MRGLILSATLTLLGLLVVLPAASASDSPEPSSRASDCAALTTRALDYLQAAEAAETKNDKIAAYQKGLDSAKKALELDDSNADAHFVVFASEGRLELLHGAIPNPLNLYKAQQRLEQVLALDPEHSDGLAAKGGLYRQLPWMLGGDLDKAESYLKRAIALNPNAIGARIELAATYLAKGEREKCKPLLDAAAALAEQEGKTYRIRQVSELRDALDAK